MITVKQFYSLVLVFMLVSGNFNLAIGIAVLDSIIISLEDKK